VYRTPGEGDRTSSGALGLLRWAARSTRGLFCEENEDAFEVFPESATFVVVDGTGARLTAGPLALRAASAFAGAADGLEPLAAGALRAWRGLQNEGPPHRGAGVALAAIRLSGQLVAHVHVGDARVYRLRGESLTRVTRDHALWLALLDEGAPLAEIASARQSHANVITRALLVGEAEPPPIEVGYVQAHAGDVWMLCTAGVTAVLADDALREACLTASGDLERAAANVLEAAERSGTHDNLTVVLVALGATV
jgi:serine/threonine protein phosphatase PrpC